MKIPKLFSFILPIHLWRTSLCFVYVMYVKTVYILKPKSFLMVRGRAVNDAESMLLIDFVL